MVRKTCYGVDISKKVDNLMVRDAIIECFMKAHGDVLEQMKECGDISTKKEFEDLSKMSVKFLIEKAFSDVGGDFQNPNKESLEKVVVFLKEYASHFRDKKVIEKHAREISALIEKLP